MNQFKQPKGSGSLIQVAAWFILGQQVLGWGVGFAQPSTTEPEPHRQREITLYATDGWHTLSGGRQMYIWGFSSIPEQGTATLPGPTIEAVEGDVVHVRVVNIGAAVAGQQRLAHTLHLHGLDVDQANDGVPETGGSIAVGSERTYTFVADQAGTYFYHCHVDTAYHMEMGMYGAVIVRPKGADNVVPDGRQVDREYTLLLSEVDPSWHDATYEGRSFDRAVYDARYYLINGMSFPEVTEHPGSLIRGAVGETILIRLINAGFEPRSMHMHGHHFEVIASDGYPLPQPWWIKDTVLIGPGERYELLVSLKQPGAYPLHSHMLLDNTNDGVYPGGIHTMMLIVGPGEDPFAAVHHHAVDIPPTDAPNVIVMGGHKFIPDVLTVQPGTTVVWLNQEPSLHSIEDAEGTFFSGNLEQGASYSYTFTDIGVFQYFCAHHAGMRGEIRVVLANE